MKNILLSVILSTAISNASALMPTNTSVLMPMSNTNQSQRRVIFIEAGNAYQCRTISRAEERNMRSGRELIRTLRSTNPDRWHFTPDSNIPPQTRDRYVAIISQAENLFNAMVYTEEERRQADQQANELLQLVPVFHRNPHGEITFFALVDHNLP